MSPPTVEHRPPPAHELDGPMLLRGPHAGAFVRANPAFREAIGFEDAQLAEAPFLEWIHPADAEIARAVLEARSPCGRVRHRTAAGGFQALDVRVTEEEGPSVILARAVVQEVVEADGPEDADDEATVSGTLHTIARIVEEENPGFRCSILLVADGRFVRGAGPSLPEEYNAAIDGFAIGPTVGSCGTAIYWNVPVIVEDIQDDPLWVPFAELAKRAGVYACWSHPFVGSSGRVLGALAFYSPEPRAPTSEQLGRLRAAARMTGLAVERGRAEEALRAQRKRELELEAQLRQAAKMEALGVLASGVAHDFNNVLTAILGNAEFARDLLPDGAEVQTMLGDIVSASRRAGQFSQQLLAYAGRGTVVGSRFDIGTVLADLGSLVSSAVVRGTSVTYELPDAPMFVHGDEGQLLQVALNLVTNAAQAIGDAGGSIVVRLDSAEYDREALRSIAPQIRLDPGAYARLVVADTGPGMDAATVARIFDPFFTTKPKGHGLGLSAVQGIIGRHRGAIQIDTEVGVGTTFTVILPITDAPEHKQPAPSRATPVQRGEAVLVVVHEAALRSVLGRRLRHSGIDVLEAEDVPAALAAFREQPDAIGCVLLDLGLPGADGGDLRGAILAVRQAVPFVLLGGAGEQEVIDGSGDGAPVEVVQKPVATEDLLAALERATGGQYR